MAKKPTEFPYDRGIAAAVKALHRGECEAHQQQNFMRWLVETACVVNEPSFWEDSVRLTDFSEGRRFVGLWIKKLNDMPLGNTKEQS